MVSFYNGVRMSGEEAEENKEDWEANAYKILDLQGKEITKAATTKTFFSPPLPKARATPPVWRECWTFLRNLYRSRSIR